jgi:hypothetical protein
MMSQVLKVLRSMVLRWELSRAMPLLPSAPLEARTTSKELLEARSRWMALMFVPFDTAVLKETAVIVEPRRWRPWAFWTVMLE